MNTYDFAERRKKGGAAPRQIYCLLRVRAHPTAKVRAMSLARLSHGGAVVWLDDKGIKKIINIVKNIKEFGFKVKLYIIGQNYLQYESLQSILNGSNIKKFIIIFICFSITYFFC